MGRNDYQNTVRDALDVMLQDPDIISSTGAVRFTRSDKRTQGRLFLRDGNAYAIALTSYPSRIVQRIFSSGLIEDDDDRARVSSHFSRDLSDPSVIDFVLMYQMVSEKNVADILKNYFVDALDELYSWQDVKAEWRAGEEFDSPITIRDVDPDSLLKVARNRAAYLAKAAADFQVNVSDLAGIVFVNKDSVPATQVDLNILSLATGSHTVDEVNERFSLALFTVIKTLHSFWEKDGVDLYFTDIKLRSFVEAYPSEVEEFEVTSPVVDSSVGVEPVVEVDDSEAFLNAEELSPIPVSDFVESSEWDEVASLEAVSENVFEENAPVTAVEADILSMDMDKKITSNPERNSESVKPSWLGQRPMKPSGFIAPDRKPTAPPSDFVVPAVLDTVSEAEDMEEKVIIMSNDSEDVTGDGGEAPLAVEEDDDKLSSVWSEEELRAVLEEVPGLDEIPSQREPSISTDSLHLVELPDSATEQAPEEDRSDILDAVAASSDSSSSTSTDVVEDSVFFETNFDPEDEVAAAFEAGIEESAPVDADAALVEEVADPAFVSEVEEVVESFEESTRSVGRPSTTLIEIIKNAAREFEVNITELVEESQIVDADITDLQRQLDEKVEHKKAVDDRLADLRSQYKEAATYLNTLRGQ